MRMMWLAVAVGLGVVGCGKHETGEEHEGHAHGHQHGAGAHSEAKAGGLCEHDVADAECGICNPQLVATLASGQGLKVRLPSTNSAGLIGLETAAPSVGAMVEAVECFAELEFNQNQLAQIVAPVSGTVQAVETDLGRQVGEKQVVARIWSASIAEAVAKAVLTHQTLDRERRLRQERVSPEKDLQEAEAAHRAACQHLRTLGFTEDQIDELGQKPLESVMLEVSAPFAGEIVERFAVRGVFMEAGKPLFTVADRSTMWAGLSIPEQLLARVQVGQEVELEVDGVPGKIFKGKLTWIGPAVDERTRMARARAEVPNPKGELRDKMYARARIITRQTQGAVLVPASAVAYVQGKPLVFVKLAADLFEARAVRLGARREGQVEVLQGLTPEQSVAVAHGFGLKSQLLISRLGAGCADD